MYQPTQRAAAHRGVTHYQVASHLSQPRLEDHPDASPPAVVIRYGDDSWTYADDIAEAEANAAAWAETVKRLRALQSPAKGAAA